MLLFPRPAIQVAQIGPDFIDAWNGATVLIGTEGETLDRLIGNFASRQPNKEILKLDDTTILIGGKL